MADYGQQLTDEELKKLEKKIAAEYKTAVKDMQKKLKDYMEKTEAQRVVQEGLLQAGKITKKEYKDWCYRHRMVGNRWKEMKKVLASDLKNANDIALGITKGTMPDIYALNGNYATWQIEHYGKIDTGFTLYNHDTANYLLGDQHQLMPKPNAKKAAEIAANKAMQWNMEKIQSAVLQGVLQGETAYQVAERLRGVGQMGYNASIRYARTMTTSAQNAGRYEAIHRAQRLGVEMVIEWQAVLDSHTRHDHRMMHGQRREVNEPFLTPDGFEIFYPADCTGASNAPQSEIWNCRCTLLPWVKGHEGDTVKDSPAMGEKSFDEWQNMKQSEINKQIKEEQEQYKPKPKTKVKTPKAEAPNTQTPAVASTTTAKASTPKQTAAVKAPEPKIEPPKVLPKPPEPAKIVEDPFDDKHKTSAKHFTDRYDADKYYRPILDENWDNMTEFEKYGVWEYTHNSNPINKSLSGYHDSWSRSSYVGLANSDWGHEDNWRTFEHTPFRTKFGTDGHANYHRAITELTNGIEKNELRDDIWLRRGSGFGGLTSLAEGGGLDFDDTMRVLNSGTKEEKEALKQMLIGRRCQEHSFLSTGIADDAGFQKPVNYEIYAPKGTKAVYAEPQSYYGATIGHKEKIYEKGHSWSGSVASEAEVIIQRGSYYRITDIEFTDYGTVNVKMDVVGQPDYFKFGDEDTFNGGKTRHKS